MTLPSCLITQPVHFDEPPNSPPAISDVASPTYPLNDILRLYGDVPTVGDGGTGEPESSFRLEVSVYDPDVDQTLQWRAFLDGTLYRGDDLPPSSSMTGRERRSLSFLVDTIRLAPLTTGCHRIDLFVSGGFQGSPTAHTPREANDIASVMWWISVEPDSSTPVTLNLCPEPMTL